MTNSQETNRHFAYIDGANLHQGLQSTLWDLDYRKFRSWLRQKFGISDATIFIGLITKNANLYTYLQNSGFRLVFKEVVYDGDGKAKGNCDADLVLDAMRNFYEKNTRHALLVSSDGDYAPLVKFWQEKGVQCAVLSPAPERKCSILLKRTGVPIIYLDDVRNKLRRHPK